MMEMMPSEEIASPPVPVLEMRALGERGEQQERGWGIRSRQGARNEAYHRDLLVSITVFLSPSIAIFFRPRFTFSILSTWSSRALDEDRETNDTHHPQPQHLHTTATVAVGGRLRGHGWYAPFLEWPPPRHQSRFTPSCLRLLHSILIPFLGIFRLIYASSASNVYPGGLSVSFSFVSHSCYQKTSSDRVLCSANGPFLTVSG